LRRKGKAKGARGSNTCFREIATRRLTPRETSITLGAGGAGFPQCGDPFAGDCDTTKDEGPLFIGQLLKPHPCGIETRSQGIAICHARAR